MQDKCVCSTVSEKFCEIFNSSRLCNKCDQPVGEKSKC